MQEDENLESKDKYEDFEAFFQLQDGTGEEVVEQIAKITKRDYSTSLYCISIHKCSSIKSKNTLLKWGGNVV